MAKKRVIEYKRMGDLVAGDILLSSEGETELTQPFEEHMPESMYLLEFGIGEEVYASGNHLWYTVNSLDKQLHRKRKKEAVHLVDYLDSKKISWLERQASSESAEAPDVSLEFVLEMLGIPFDDDKAVQQVTRIIQSIGPTLEMHEKMFDELDDSLKPAGTPAIKMFSLKYFCQQVLALVKTVRKSLTSSDYELLVGKVRTTEEIANTQEFDHDFTVIRSVTS